MSYQIRDAVVGDAPALADAVIDPIVTTFQGLVPDQCLSWLTKAESAANWQNWFRREEEDGRFLLVAELDAGPVIGCALAGPQPDDPRFDGELYLLGVLPAYQGRGIGRRLVQTTALRLHRHGMRSLRVGVLSINPNRGFYERLNGRFVTEQPYNWNGVTLMQTFYGWDDVTVLLPS